MALDFVQDGFNLTGLQSVVEDYDNVVRLICDYETGACKRIGQRHGVGAQEGGELTVGARVGVGVGVHVGRHAEQSRWR